MAKEAISREGVKTALKKFKTEGDERWAKADKVGELVKSALDDEGILTDEDIGELTEDELASIVDALSDPEEEEGEEETP